MFKSFLQDEAHLRTLFSAARHKPLGPRSAGRRLLVFIAFLAAVGMFAASVAQARRKKAAPPPPGLPDHIHQLARRLYGVALDDAGPITSQIQDLVLGHLEEWLPGHLSGDAPLDVAVRRELERTFSQLQYPLFSQPAVFAQPWKGATLVGAGYTLGWTDYDRANVLALFEMRGGKTRLAAVTPFVPRTDLHYEFLNAPVSEDFWFMVWGHRLGKSQSRLSAVLYSYDGQTLKSLWETRDAYDGKIDVERDRVLVRYLKEDEYVRAVERKSKPPRHEAIYRISPQGLSLETDHEIPF